MKHTVCEFWPSSKIERHSSEEVIFEKAIERGSKLGQGQVHYQTSKELNISVETCVIYLFIDDWAHETKEQNNNKMTM